MSTKRNKTGRNAELLRATEILNELIEGKEHDRRTVCAEWEVSPGTADRDLKGLAKVAGVVSEKKGQRTVYRFDVGTLISSRLRHNSVVAACFGASLSSVFEGSNHQKNLLDALDFLVQQSKRRKVFQNVDRKFIFVRRGGEQSLPDHAVELDELIEAILQSEWVTIDYHRFSGEQETLQIAPLSMAIYDHQLYVIAKSERQPLYAYRFSRIKSVERNDQTFKYPSTEEYNPINVFRERFGIFMSDDHPVENIQVWLGPRWKNYAATHRWHSSQQTEDDDDGVIVKFRVRTCPQLEAWILGFGENARVIGPISLRERIHERIHKMAKGIAGEKR